MKLLVRPFGSATPERIGEAGNIHIEAQGLKVQVIDMGAAGIDIRVDPSGYDGNYRVAHFEVAISGIQVRLSGLKATGLPTTDAS